MLSRIVIISLVLSFQSLALAGELPSNNIEIISFDAGTTPAPVLIASPTIKSSSEAVKVVDIGHSSNLTTVIPVINVALPPSTKLPTVHHESVVVLPANNSIVEPTHRFGEYMKPICDALEKLSPKQIFRVQSQMKQFVQLTGGKLAVCFLEHYMIDPALQPVGKPDISLICQSRGLASSRGSMKAFQICANSNWDESLDKELDRILAIRLNNLKKHAHLHNQNSTGTNQTNINVDHHLTLLHDDEDGEGVTLVNDVVSKVLDTSKMNSSDVKVIDAASPVKITTIKPSIEVHLETTKAPIANHSGILTADGVLNDQKTVFVLLDDAGKTTVAPKKAHNATQVPVHLNVTLAKSTAHPKVTVKIEGTTVTTVKPTAASSPISTTPKQTHVMLVSSTSAPSASKTVVLIEKGKVTTGSPSLALLVKPTLSPIIKPLETFEQVLERQEKEKHDLDVKFRLEREKLIKDMRKKQDDIDAQNAIKALQNQRQATSSTSRVPDSKLHQLEHDRQMAIDPIGHTIKHQQYEISKQRVLLGRK